MARKMGAERIFSVDLKSRKAVKTASLGNGGGNGVAIEGTLGTLERASFLEGVVLEIVGTFGVLRVDLSREELLGNSRTATAASRAGEVVN